MAFRSLLARWKSGQSGRGRSQPWPAPRGRRLALEQFDDRVLLSNYAAASVTALIADINASNAAGGSNTITLTAATTSPYVLTAANNTTDGATGLPVIAAKDNLTILGSGDTSETPNTARSSAAHFRLFDVAAGASLTLGNMTLQGGFAEGYHPLAGGADVPAEGGAIYNQGALTLSGVTVQRNIAQGVGGSFSVAGPGCGGGIWSNGSLTLENGTLLYANQAVGMPAETISSWEGGGSPPGNAYGGAVYLAGGTANITSTTFTSNHAYGGLSAGGDSGDAFGGALYVAAGQVALTTTTVNSNGANTLGSTGSTPVYEGGGICVAGGTVALAKDTVQFNGANDGSGIYVAGGTATLTNDTVESNVSAAIAGYGGGLFIASGASVSIDAFTLAHVINNTAANDPNIDGSYIKT